MDLIIKVTYKIELKSNTCWIKVYVTQVEQRLVDLLIT